MLGCACSVADGVESVVVAYLVDGCWEDEGMSDEESDDEGRTTTKYVTPHVSTHTENSVSISSSDQVVVNSWADQLANKALNTWESEEWPGVCVNPLTLSVFTSLSSGKGAEVFTPPAVPVQAARIGGGGRGGCLVAAIVTAKPPRRRKELYHLTDRSCWQRHVKDGGAILGNTGYG